jgi:ribonuclease P protein component
MAGSAGDCTPVVKADVIDFGLSFPLYPAPYSNCRSGSTRLVMSDDGAIASGFHLVEHGRMCRAEADRSIRREKDLPAQQARAEAPPRIPGPHGHCRWPQGHRGSSCPRPQEAFRLTTAPVRLKRRRDFLAVARGTRVHLPAFTLQAKRRDGSADLDPGVGRVGLTVTKKTGSAVERNRIKRRLREALRHAEALPTDRQTDYVIVARREALSLQFGRLIIDLERAIGKAGVQSNKPRGSGKPPRRKS